MAQVNSNVQEGYIEKGVPTPYKPSWINRSIHFVAGLKVPSPAFYFIGWIAFYTILTLLRWNDQVYPAGSLDISDLVMAATGIFFIALVQYLDQWAGKKLRLFRNSMAATEQEFDTLVYQLSTLPAGPTLLASLITLGFGASTFLLSPDSYGFLNLNFSSLSGGLQLINFLFSWFVFGALSYHAYRQLRLGSQALSKYIPINLFNLDPIYAFAGLTLRTALGWLIMAYAWALTTPHLFGNVIIIGTILFMQFVAILTFVLPLLNAHTRIVNKKDEFLHEIGGRLEVIIDKMSKSTDALEKEDLIQLRETLTTLTMAEDRLRKLPTWPWRAGTANSLVSAILIPNAIWFFQIILERYVFR
jgi:hypothetical protein